MSELVTCSGCSRVWDGYAQCPCGLDEDQYQVDDPPEILDISGKVWKNIGTRKKEVWSLTPIEDDPIDYLLLSREQIMKGIFLQLGTKKGLPKDIIIFIYNMMKKEMIMEEDKVRKYFMNTIYHVTLLSQNNNIDTESSDFKTRIPLNRGLEWAIKWDGTHNECCKITQRRIYLIEQINIIGEENYLHQIVGFNESHRGSFPIYAPASLKRKILYLNTSPKDEVLEDYDTYQEAVSFGNDFRIHIDVWGEAMIHHNQQ